MNTPRKIIPLKNTPEFMGWSRGTLYNRIRDGSFPAPLKTGPRTRGYFEDDLKAAQERFTSAVAAPRTPRSGH